MRKSRILIAVAALGLVIAGAVALVWALDRDTTKSEAGTCGAASYRLEVEEDDGLLDGSFELRTVTTGESWQVRVEHDGQVLHESEQLSDDEAEIDIDVRLPLDAGGELTATATSATGDQTCSASLTLD